MSHLMEGIFNIFEKMAFLIFLPSQGVHLQDVHDSPYYISISGQLILRSIKVLRVRVKAVEILIRSLYYIIFSFRFKWILT